MGDRDEYDKRMFYSYTHRTLKCENYSKQFCST